MAWDGETAEKTAEAGQSGTTTPGRVTTRDAASPYTEAWTTHAAGCTATVTTTVMSIFVVSTYTTSGILVGRCVRTAPKGGRRRWMGRRPVEIVSVLYKPPKVSLLRKVTNLFRKEEPPTRHSAVHDHRWNTHGRIFQAMFEDVVQMVSAQIPKIGDFVIAPEYKWFPNLPTIFFVLRITDISIYSSPPDKHIVDVEKLFTFTGDDLPTVEEIQRVIGERKEEEKS